MKSAKRRSWAFFLSLAFFLVAARLIKADGGLIPPPGYSVYETDQKAVIFYDEGIEHLIISATFQGDADDFAWVIPTPAKPEVEKSTDFLFTRLDEMTRPLEAYPERSKYSGMSLQGDGMNEPGVSVLETKKIEYYEISVLEANDKDALYNWLNDHGYHFPQSGKYIAEDYIQKGWFFTAIKISNDSASAVATNQLRTGHAVPLRLTFNSDSIVYPLKISSLNGMADNAPEGEVTYVDGQAGKGVQIDTDRILATDRVIKGFNIDDGRISFSLKKRSTSPLGEIITVETPQQNNSLRQDGVVISNPSTNKIQFRYWRSGAFRETATIDLGSDFKENQWQKYEFIWTKNPSGGSKQIDLKFLIDGVERTVQSESFDTTGTTPLPQQNGELSSQIVVGGSEVFRSQKYQQNSGDVTEEPLPAPQYRSTHTEDIIIDSIIVSSNQQQVFKADFENNLEIFLNDGSKNVFRVFSNSASTNRGGASYIAPPSSVGVLLYVFADKRYEIPGFETQFAHWMDKEDIENIALVNGNTPWIKPSGQKYFLTRMYNAMSTAEMSDDLYPVPSKIQQKPDSPMGENGRYILLYTLSAVSILTIGGSIWYVLKSTKEKEGNAN